MVFLLNSSFIEFQVGLLALFYYFIALDAS